MQNIQYDAVQSRKFHRYFVILCSTNKISLSNVLDANYLWKWTVLMNLPREQVSGIAVMAADVKQIYFVFKPFQ